MLIATGVTRGKIRYMSTTVKRLNVKSESIFNRFTVAFSLPVYRGFHPRLFTFNHFAIMNINS